MLGQKARTLIENIPVQIHFFRKVPKDITEVRAASQMYISTHTVRCSHPFLPSGDRTRRRYQYCGRGADGARADPSLVFCGAENLAYSHKYDV